MLYYMLQQVQEFPSSGEDFAMQHKDSEYLGEVEEELQTAVLEAIPVERRLRGLTPEELLRVLSPEEMVRGLSKEQAWEHVVALSEWAPQPIDFQILEFGQQVQARHGLSWWDSLIVAAAYAQGCGILLTEDLQHDADYAGVTAVNPFIARVQDAPGRYAPALPSPPLRGRGRPKKAASTA